MLSLAPQSLEVLKDYSWPGNVRELQNIIERLVTMAETDPVDPEEIRSYLDPGARTVTRGTLKVVVDQAEREAVERALAQANGNVAEAAVALGILVPSLYRLMRRFTIATPTQIQNRDLPPT